MKKSRFTEAQIVAILKELDAGTAATERLRPGAWCMNCDPDESGDQLTAESLAI